MRAFFVRWRSARQFREFELFADEKVGAGIVAALEASGGMVVWQSGALWKCPGCGDRTVRTEEFVEGLRRAEEYLQDENANVLDSPTRQASLKWIADVGARLFGCERDRVYIKDAGTDCTFSGASYISRI